MVLAAIVLSVCPPARLLALQCPDGTPPPCGRVRPGVAPASVAVLYFENLSRDTADLSLTEGLTEELTSRLGDITRLRVSGTSAVRRAQRALTDDLPGLGRALGVRYLVEGSVRRSGESVRIGVRLLRATDGVRVWGETYDRSLTDLLALEEDIARQVVTNVVGQLLPAERTRLAARPTTNPDAYVHYLRGSYLVTRRSAPGAFRGAVAEFDEALRLDPRYVAALAKRAYALTLSWAYGVPWLPVDTIRGQIRSAVAAALRLDSSSSDAWMARGIARTFLDRDMYRAVQYIERAVQLDPRNVEAQHTLGVNLMWIGQDSAATAALRRALALDAGRAVTMLDLAELAYLGGRPRDALALLDSAAAADPEQARIHMMRARVERSLGNLDAALVHARDGSRLSPGGLHQAGLAVLALAEAAGGDSGAARRDAGSLDTTAILAYRVLALAAVGDREAVLGLLERSTPDWGIWYELRFPEYTSYRNDPRFVRIFEAWRPAPRAQ